MWKPSLPSTLLSKHASSRNLSSDELEHTQQVEQSRDDIDVTVGSNERSNSKRFFLRRMSLPTVSRPQWGKRIHKRMAQARTNDKKKSILCFSTSTTKLSEESTSVTSDLSPSEQLPRSVRFSVVQVREFDRTVGENPACKVGPPLSLGWSFVEGPEQWLMNHHPDDDMNEAKIKRTIQQLYIPAERRIALLRDEWDVSEQELAASMHIVNKIKKSRQKVVMEFRQMVALKQQQQQQQQQAAQSNTGTDFPVIRVEC